MIVNIFKRNYGLIFAKVPKLKEKYNVVNNAENKAVYTEKYELSINYGNKYSTLKNKNIMIKIIVFIDETIIYMIYDFYEL